MKTKRAHIKTAVATEHQQKTSIKEQSLSAFAMDDPRTSGSAALLKALHILTREGQLNQDSRRKLKQVNHLIQLMAQPLRQCFMEKATELNAHTLNLANIDRTLSPLVVVDHGCGKSYLGFMLYEQLSRSSEPLPLHVIGIETRAPLVEHARALAKELDFKGMEFLNISAKEAATSKEVPSEIDVVTALHACDTASDDAIEFALSKRAQLVFLVPCCQAELAAKLKAGKALSLAKTPLAELWRHPLHTREMGSQLTNVLRCLYLESQGYKVSVTELVGWEHSMKNELITATYTGQFKRSAALRLMALLEEFGLESLSKERYPRVLEQLRLGKGENLEAETSNESDDAQHQPEAVIEATTAATATVDSKHFDS